MPEHQTWFRFLPNYEQLRLEAQTRLGYLGKSVINRDPLEIQHVFCALVVFVLLLLVGIIVWRKVRDAKAALIPEKKLTVRTFAEMVTEMVLGQMESQMGPKEARVFLPLIGTCAFFILFSNALGMIPGLAPPTSNLNTTLACAVIVVLTAEVYGFKRHGLGYLKEFLGPLHKPIHFLTLLPIMMFVIEIIGHTARMMSLSVRLLGNMYADHTVVGIFLLLVPYLALTALPVQLLGVLVIVIQTVVFCILSIVYISLAVAHEESEEHGSH